MKARVTFVRTKYYGRDNIMQWVWFFRKMRYVKGFIIRVFGFHLSIFENNATEKLIQKFKG